ncbi:tetratricopeptide repeat protein [Actinosynnema sp. NPDC050436]|uniref:tetratricopeptide repeat protein n=1 Tax=Actinosynnema sp. NPDC050436 TaxID=3155659 RepID=UPI0033D81554
MNTAGVGAVVQAGAVHGGVHVHRPAHDPVVPRQLPALPDQFVGRAAEIALLGQAPGAGPVLVSAIGGTGGIGKTWLVLRWAQDHLAAFPDGQLFVDLHGFSPDGTPMEPIAAVRGFLVALGVEPARIPVDLHAQTALYRTIVAGRRMLVVLDNAADSAQVEPLLPGGDSCTTVVTSRRTLHTLITRHGARHLPLDVLPDDEARALLVRRLGSRRADDNAEPVDHVIALCRGLPLALAVIASRALAHPQVSLGELVTDLRELGVDALAEDDPASSLPAVLSWSYRALPATHKSALGLLAIAPGADIGLPAAANLIGRPPAHARRVLRQLEEASLLRQDADGRYAMHDLVRSHAMAAALRDVPADERHQALLRVISFYLHTARQAKHLLVPAREALEVDPAPPGSTPLPLTDLRSAFDWFETEHRNLLAAQKTACDEGDEASWKLAWAMVNFHLRRGRCHEDLAAWRTALSSLERMPDPVGGIVVRIHLGDACSQLDLHREAAPHLHEALARARDAGLHGYEALAHLMIGRSHELQQQDHQALQHASEAVRLYTQVGNEPMRAFALNATGTYAANLGNYDLARRNCDEALVLHRKYGQESSQSHALDTLAYIDHRTGNHQRSIEIYRRALQMRLDIGHLHGAANILHRIGHPYLALGRRREARTAWQEARQMYRRQGRDREADQVDRLVARLASITDDHTITHLPDSPPRS